MILYLLRHAIAVDRSLWKGTDRKRPLTEEGRRSMRKAAKGLKHLAVSFDQIVSSPYDRAHATAQIVAEAMKFRRKIVLSAELIPQGDPQALLSWLRRRYSSATDILIVGHEPYLSTLVSLLLGHRGRLPLELKKGGLCRLGPRFHPEERIVAAQVVAPSQAFEEVLDNLF